MVSCRLAVALLLLLGMCHSGGSFAHQWSCNAIWVELVCIGMEQQQIHHERGLLFVVLRKFFCRQASMACSISSPIQ